MVLFDPHRRWGPRGICTWEDRGLFFAEAGMHNRKPADAVQALWDQAKEICAMCPVLKECQRDTLGEEYGVYGGRDPYERYRIRRAMPAAVRKWPEERKLAWGRQIHRLRAAGLKWHVIQIQTGLPPAAAELLHNLWEERLAEKGTTGQVVDLELPETGRGKTPFPDKPGRRHAWVRHRGLVSDAWYRGQTPDGEWISVSTYAGHGNVNKWFRRNDVHLYQPQAVVILNYIGRPDDDDTHDLTA